MRQDKRSPGSERSEHMAEIICRKQLDQERGQSWICACPWCNEARREEDERLLHGERVGQGIPGHPQDDLPETVGQGDTGV